MDLSRQNLLKRLQQDARMKASQKKYNAKKWAEIKYARSIREELERS